MDKSLSIFKNISKNIIDIIFFIIIAFLTIISIFYTCMISIEYNEVTYFLKDNPLRNILIIILLIFLLWILNKNKNKFNFIERINNDKKLFNKIKIILLILLFCLSLFWVLNTNFYPAADQKSVQNTAVQILNKNFYEFNDGSYLSIFPHQSGYIIISCLISLLIGPENYLGLEIINILMVILIYKALADIGEEFKMSNFSQLLIILSAFIFPIIPLYSYFVYGNIPGLAFILLAIKREIKYFKTFETKDLCLLTIYTILALTIRTNNLIACIAMIIYAILKIIDLKRVKAIIVLLALLIAIPFQSRIPISILENISNKKLDNAIPSIAWVAMSMQESDRAPGWFNGYTISNADFTNYNVEKQKELAKQTINERLDIFNKDKNYAFEFFTKKVVSTWNNPTFQALWNIFDKPYSQDNIFKNFLTRQGIDSFSKYLNIIHHLILFGTLCYLLFNKNKDIDLYLLPLIVIGGFLFHIIWETKSQYAFSYFVLLIPYTIMGYKELIDNINDIKNIKISIKLISKVIIILLLLITFASSKSSFLREDNQNYLDYLNNVE